MASVQGIIDFGGTDLASVYYTAYYNSNNGGGSGQGSGQRQSQWMRNVKTTEEGAGLGQYTVSLSSDIFLGANATVANGDEVTIIAWRDSNGTIPNAGASFAGQNGSNGTGGSHSLGFKYDNGNNTIANYADIDQAIVKTFTMTSNSWTATHNGTGGDVDGDLTLILTNTQSPTATINGGSTNLNTPVNVNLKTNLTFNNNSADDTTPLAYMVDGQIIFGQSCAANCPTNGTQTSDGSSRAGSTFSYFDGSSYSQDKGTVLSDVNGVNNPSAFDNSNSDTTAYEGPDFENTTHEFTHIDIYKVNLEVQDDTDTTGSIDQKDYFYRTQYRDSSVAITTREFQPWSSFITNATSNDFITGFGTGNSNTINDVCKVSANITSLDNNDYLNGASEVLVSTGFTLDGSASFALNLTAVGTDINLVAPFGFVTFLTQTGNDVRHCYEIIGRTDDNNITIDCNGSTQAYTTKDWFITGLEPCGGSAVRYSWEINTGSWTSANKTNNVFASGITGTGINITNIGNDVIPGSMLIIKDGPAKGNYQIITVTNDDNIILAGSGITSTTQAGDTYCVGFDNSDLFIAQEDNDIQNIRCKIQYTRGWGDVANPWDHTLIEDKTATQNGSINNIPPEAIYSVSTSSGSATTYNFDGRKSYGTASTIIQDSTFAGTHTLDGDNSTTIIDANIDTSNLRDGHSWLILLNADDHIIKVYPIDDIDHTDNTSITINDNGDSITINIGDKFRTTNAFEIEGTNPKEISNISWDLRMDSIAVSAPVTPINDTQFNNRFDTELSLNNSGEQWAYTFADTDTGKFACVKQTVTDPEGASDVLYTVFEISVAGASGVAGFRRIEWE